ncbi:MAG: TNT domain-containing protein [Actinomycetaceae bacterium]|nr:TNT domain-containing protein [Actinomycetaceae bacterium]
MIGSVGEFEALCSSDSEEDFLRATTDEAPTFVWEEIIRKRPNLAEIVAMSSTIPPSVLEMIAIEAPWKARYRVAQLRNTPGHILERLSTDEESEVRRAVVSNTTTPLSVLSLMRKDEDDAVATLANMAWEDRGAKRGGRHAAGNQPAWEVEQPPSEPLPEDSEVGRYGSYFERLCSEYGLNSAHVVRGYDPRDTDLPAPQEGPWIVAPWGEEQVIGAMRGDEFTIYSFASTIEEAMGVVARLVHEPVPVKVAPEDVEDRGRRTGLAIEYRCRERDGRPGPNELAPGDVLDTFDDDHAHFLFALGTPFINRSQSKEVLSNPYHAYELLAPLPMAVVEGIAAPGNNMPGGGAMIVLDRPVRWYIDNGYLIEIR